MPPEGEKKGSIQGPIAANGKSNKVGINNDGMEMSTMDMGAKAKEAGLEGYDPWAGDMKEVKPDTPWKELSCRGKCVRILWNYISKPILLIGALYLFICSLDILSSAFRLLGGKAAGQTFANNEILQNPVAGLMVGVLATVLLQSSSTTSSIIISMVAGKVMYVRTAIPIIMGANIGTSVTNTIVSMGHVSDVDEFRRAFGGATVHDMFNWLSVIVFLPLEVVSHYLEYLTDAIVESMPLESYTSGKQDLLKAITKPLTALVISVDSDKITDIATNGEATDINLIKIWCKSNTTYVMGNVTYSNVTGIGGENVTSSYVVEELVAKKVGVVKCVNMFMDVAGVWSDEVIGAILLVLALLVLCSCLVIVVKILNSILKGSIANALKKFVNADLPGKLSWLTGYLAIIVGAGLTILVQSSSVFTSTLTPLVGVGVLQLDRMYPLTLGSNIGTTATGMLASLAASGDTLKDSLQVAFCHLFFNISGIILWYPIPFMRQAPIKLAMLLGNKTAKYRWFAVFYLFIMFFVAPATVFGLSLAGWYVLLAVAGPLVLLFMIIVLINVCQNKCPNRLPKKLRNWRWLPLCCHSLEPLDRVFRKICFCFKCCQQNPPQKLPNTVSVEPEVASTDDIPIVISRELSRDTFCQTTRDIGVQFPHDLNVDPELRRTTNYAFEADETETDWKPEPEIKINMETGSKPEQEVKITAETEMEPRSDVESATVVANTYASEDLMPRSEL
ncbi:sodium-dependent phosphate transport protein 2B-like [Lineus longissimus]|uniref:sodium-dependent phosphate transport protein 2B-like n=1 Tax=Lineus longissimus TaxID=88925 RepID=UPI00315C6FFF